MAVRIDLFTHTLNTLRGGAAQEELSVALNECVIAARESGAASKLTIEITVKPNGHSGQYKITESWKTKLPKMDQGETLFFGTPDGNLTREDPRQQSLGLRRAEQEELPPELRKVT